MRETLRKEQLIQRILLISMILLSILLGTIIVNASDTGQPVKYYTSIVVEHNDTLWSLEERYNNGTEDQIVVKKCSSAENGDIVVALIDDSATVKRFYRENGHVRLQPENDFMDPIIIDDCMILGKVIGLMRWNIS